MIGAHVLYGSIVDGPRLTSMASTTRGKTRRTPSVHGSQLAPLDDRGPRDSNAPAVRLSNVHALGVNATSAPRSPIGTWQASTSSTSQALLTMRFESATTNAAPSRSRPQARTNNVQPMRLHPRSGAPGKRFAQREQPTAIVAFEWRRHRKQVVREPAHALVNAATNVATSGPRSERPTPLPCHDAAARAPLALECICVSHCSPSP